MNVVSRVIEPIAAGLELAGDVGGVPGLGAAGALIAAIQNNCDKVVSHKGACKRLADKATKLHNTFEEHQDRLKDSELRKYTDDVQNTLQKVNTRTRRWASYSRFSAFRSKGLLNIRLVNDNKIADGIKKCETELETVLESFTIGAQISAEANQQQLLAMVKSNHEDLRSLILHIMANPDGARQVAELESQGEHVAARVMEEGQLGLRAIRERHVTFEVPEASSSNSPKSDANYIRVQRSLSKLHTLTGVPPAVKVLNGEVTREGEIPVAGGTYSDVWNGMWMLDQKVALKALRGIRVTSPKAQKRFERELNVWSSLDHPNILKFLGIVTDIGHFIHMVSPWQDYGCVPDFLKKYPNANRQHLLVGASLGLEYLHQKAIVHGNVKGANILVSAKGEACICDFGMSKVVEDVTEQAASATLTKQGSVRWLAPELIEGDISSPSHACDIYSFGMTIFECTTLEIPFSHIKRDAQVIHKLMQFRIKPIRPESPDSKRWLTDSLWDLMMACWQFTPDNRPPMSEIAQRMREIEIEVEALHTNTVLDTVE